MGLFSSKKKTYVSSVTYPLGEEDDDRTDFLKYTVLNATLQGRSVAKSITQGYLTGQGMTLRNAFKYARDKYTNGVPRSEASYSDSPDTAALQTILGAQHPGKTIELVTIMVGTSDFIWWAERWLAEHYGYDRMTGIFSIPPPGVEVDANVTYDLEPNGTIRILLMNSNGSSRVLDYRPTDLVNMADYVHAAYVTKHTLLDSETTTTRPTESGDVAGTDVDTETVNNNGESHLITTTTVVSLSGSNTTIEVTVTRLITSRARYFIYRIGTGTYPVLDGWQTGDALDSPYYPSIPLRVDNQDWTAGEYRNRPLYDTSKALLKKVGLDIDDIAKNINDNESIDDIDYCFAVFGVSLNTKTQEGKRYLYRFFEHLRTISQVNSNQFGEWEDNYNGGSRVAPPINKLQIYSETDRANNHDVKLEWQFIDTRQVEGVVAPGAKPGDVAIVMGGTRIEFNLFVDVVVDNSKLYARRQIDADTYEEMEIAGLTYENFIYKGKSVILSAYDAFQLDDQGNEEEGFVLPLNQAIVRVTPLKELTDLAYQCMHLVFNCYQVVKQKWYERSWFKWLLIIVAIVITVLVWGADGGTTIGAAMAYGAAAALGATGLLLTYLAATIYVLGMMVLSMVIGKLATSAFGEEWGAVIAVIATIVVMDWANTSTAAASAATAGTSATMLTAQNLLQATSALSSVYGAYAQGQMGEIMEEAAEAQAEYQAGMDKIEEMTEAFLDTNTDVINITGFTDATYQILYELPSTFLDRTLMVGSDIAAITEGLIENFTEVGLQLPTTG